MTLSPRVRRRRGTATVTAGLALSALLLSACSGGGAGGTTDGAGRPADTTGAATASAATGSATTGSAATGSPATTSAAGNPAASSPAASTSGASTAKVHISLLNNDGATYGVGMPVIAYFSKTITDAAPLQRATTVTVDGTPAQGAWFFEQSRSGKGPLEAHFRLEHYWPAHAHVRVEIAAEGVSAGKGLEFDDSLFSDFHTGARTISTVDNSRHTITVVTDGKTIGTYPVSLGAKGSPTERGTKVIMEQDRDTRMQGDSLSGHYDDPHVFWTQRLTYEGEYLHAAPWNDPDENGGVGNIGSGNSSNGCTNLTTDNARTLYKLMRVGDVVRYPNANGRQMQLGDGYGDWNPTWQQWRTGGLVPTT